MSADTSFWPGLSWTRMDHSELMFPLLDRQHLYAIGWSIAMIAFGFLILAFDTRPVRSRRVSVLRDRIVGLEQRYFLVILNGLLLYGALITIFQSATQQTPHQTLSF